MARLKCSSIPTRGPRMAPSGSRVFAPSKDAKYAVYGISRSGSDWQEYQVMELATKQTLSDRIDWVKVSNVAWQGDGFYYSRYPAPAEGKEKASINENHQVLLPPRRNAAVRGSSWSTRIAATPQRFHIVDTTEDERFAILSISDRGKGKDGNALLVRDLSKGEAEFTPVIPTIGDETFGVIDNVGDKLLVQTNRNAPNWRVVLIDPKQPGEATGRRCCPNARAARQCEHGRREAVCDLSEGRGDQAYTSTAWTARSRTRSRCPVPERRAGSAASATIRSCSTASIR